MDPFSVVGLAASLVTLTGLAIQSTKTIKEICHELNNAPDSLRRCLAISQELERLLTLVRDRASHYADKDIPLELKQSLSYKVTQMTDDYTKLCQICTKLRERFDCRSISNQAFRARLHSLRYLKEISEVEERLSGHFGKFKLFLLMIIE